MTVLKAAREIGAIVPIAANQADRTAEEVRLAVLRRKAPASEHDQAVAVRDWISREGNVQNLSERLSQIDSGQITVRHEPGAPAVERLGALADGINRELAQQRTIATPVIEPNRSIERDIER